MEEQNIRDSTFYEVNLRSEPLEKASPRPHSTSKLHDFVNSAFRRTFKMKKRRHNTTPISENEILKCSISGPANCSKVNFSENDFAFSRNSIQCCPFDISGYGSCILMDEFTVKKPKKMTIMVYLYEKIIILTKRKDDEDVYYYIGSIRMDQLGLLPLKKGTKLLELKDHVNSTKFHRNIVYKLEAPTEYIQMQWRRAIEKCLWGQLLKAKEISLQNCRTFE